jgi:hypothetical protein
MNRDLSFSPQTYGGQVEHSAQMQICLQAARQHLCRVNRKLQLKHCLIMVAAAAPPCLGGVIATAAVVVLTCALVTAVDVCSLLLSALQQTV